MHARDRSNAPSVRLSAHWHYARTGGHRDEPQETEASLQRGRTGGKTQARPQARDWHAGAQNEIKCKDPIGTIDRWAKQEETDPYAYGIAGQCVAQAIISGRKEWMYTDHHLAFGGFCHNVRIGSYFDLYYEDLLSESFQERVKQWQESELVDDIYGPKNPFLFNQGLWSSEQGREIIRHFGGWSCRAYERLEVQFRETHPVWFTEEDCCRKDDFINMYISQRLESGKQVRVHVDLSIFVPEHGYGT